jgi:hypothetical protein
MKEKMKFENGAVRSFASEVKAPLSLRTSPS